MQLTRVFYLPNKSDIKYLLLRTEGISRQLPSIQILNIFRFCWGGLSTRENALYYVRKALPRET